MTKEFKAIEEPEVPEIDYFTCGYCLFGRMVSAPPEKREQYPIDRGYCIFEPPKVFPMPVQETQKIAAMGTQPKVAFRPHMERPVVDADEPMCGRGVLTNEAMKALGLDKIVGGPEEEELCSGGPCTNEDCACG